MLIISGPPCISVTLPNAYKSDTSPWTVAYSSKLEMAASVIDKCRNGTKTYFWFVFVIGMVSTLAIINTDYFYQQ